VHRLVLAVIVVVYVLIAGLYAVKTPLWQAPDEPAHFNYIRTIGDTGTLPILAPGDYDQGYLEKIKAAKFPPSMPVDSIRYESYQPPLYYLSATPAYWIGRIGGLTGQVLAVRFYSIALGVVILLLTFVIIRELFPDDRLLALATVGLVATIPMHIAITASVSNDTGAELILALILLLSIRRAKNTISDRTFLVLGTIVFGAALLTKLTAFVTGAALLIGAELAYAVLLQSPAPARAARFKSSLFRLVSLFAISLAISAPMFIRNMLTYGITDLLGTARHDAIVVGQPTTAEMIRQYGFSHIAFDFIAVTFKSFWAQFGWMGVLVNDRIYVVLFVLTGLAVFGLVLYAIRIARERQSLAPAQWWGTGLFALLVGVSIVDYIGYNFKFFQLQGRYLFPAIVPIAFFMVVGLRELLAKPYVRLTFALLYLALAGLDIASLFLYIVPQLRV
jgi:hypothetical protein